MRQFPQRYRRRQSPEGQIVLQIIKSLRARGYEAYKIKTQGSPKPGGGYIFDPYRLTGWGDIIAWRPQEGWIPTLYILEVKTTTNDQTDNQKAFEKVFHYPPSRIYAVVHSTEEALAIVQAEK